MKLHKEEISIIQKIHEAIYSDPENDTQEYQIATRSIVVGGVALLQLFTDNKKILTACSKILEHQFNTVNNPSDLVKYWPYYEFLFNEAGITSSTVQKNPDNPFHLKNIQKNVDKGEENWYKVRENILGRKK